MSEDPVKKDGPVHILLHISGSISCYKACELASLLVKKDCEVQVTASAGALRFLQPAVFEGLTHRPLLTDIFGGKPDFIPHISLAQRWADVIIAYPASADCINRLAAGFSDDLFGAVCLANNFRRPLLIAPAMNSEMFAHPAVRQSLEQLSSWGAVILPTESGQLACGAIGQGLLIAPERAAVFIATAAHSALKVRQNIFGSKQRRILITGGGCREPIDGVRCITNLSTGKTAAFLADCFASGGAQVTYLAAQQSIFPETAGRIQNHPDFRLRTFCTAGDLSALMRSELSESAYDAVIHAAAVSDFKPAHVTVDGESVPAGKLTGKVSSDADLSVTFAPVPKIAGEIGKWAEVGNPAGKTVVVCFKLTDGENREGRLSATSKLFGRGNVDYIVSNDRSELDGEIHPFELFSHSSDKTVPVSVCTGKTLRDLADALVSVLQEVV